jgi:aryl-alcohol dehydrogenase-like predicted oxidoreductase
VFGWTVDEATAFTLFDAFLEAGGNFIDTADVYSSWVPGNKGGESETIIGKWIRARSNRDKVVIATKVGSDMGPGRKGLSKAYIRSAVDESLRRLQTDYIDLYFSHWDDPDTAIEETLEAYGELVRAGKVRFIGASNFNAARLKAAIGISAKTGLPRYECLQPHFNLVDRDGFQGELEKLCRDNEIGVVTYYSLASGFLTGKYRSEKDLRQRARGSRVANYLNERGFAVLKALDEVAAQARATPAQVALTWLMARPGITAPIASATTIDQLKDLIAATLLKLDPASIERLDRAGA